MIRRSSVPSNSKCCFPVVCVKTSRARDTKTFQFLVSGSPHGDDGDDGHYAGTAQRSESISMSHHVWAPGVTTMNTSAPENMMLGSDTLLENNNNNNNSNTTLNHDQHPPQFGTNDDALRITSHSNNDVDEAFFESLTRLREKLIETMSSTGTASSSFSSKATLEILSPDKQRAALAYDNPTYFPHQQEKPRTGYFGWKRLFKNRHDSPVLIWGDFQGVRILPSMNHILKNPEHAVEEQTPIFQLGVDSRVMAVQVSPVRHGGSVVFFVGFDTGALCSVLATPTQTTSNTSHPQFFNSFSYQVLEETHKDNGEITCLSLLGGPYGTTQLLSSTVDGCVRLYPDALNPNAPDLKNSFSPVSREAANKIHCVASTVIGEWVVMCLFLNPKHAVIQAKKRNASLMTWDQCLWDLRPEENDAEACAEKHAVTRCSFLPECPEEGIFGTNEGCLHKFRLELSDDGDGGVNVDDNDVFQVNLPNAHTGAIEAIEIIGNVVFTCGGNDGCVKAWNSSDMSPLGSFQVHEGNACRAPSISGGSPSLVRLACAVVSILPRLEQDSLLCLCRDGSLFEWNWKQDEDERAAEHAMLQAVLNESDHSGASCATDVMRQIVSELSSTLFAAERSIVHSIQHPTTSAQQVNAEGLAEHATELPLDGELDVVCTPPVEEKGSEECDLGGAKISDHQPTNSVLEIAATAYSTELTVTAVCAEPSEESAIAAQPVEEAVTSRLTENEVPVASDEVPEEARASEKLKEESPINNVDFSEQRMNAVLEEAAACHSVERSTGAASAGPAEGQTIAGDAEPVEEVAMARLAEDEVPVASDEHRGGDRVLERLEEASSIDTVASSEDEVVEESDIENELSDDNDDDDNEKEEQEEKESSLWTVAKMDHFVASANSAMKHRMQMRIMQAAVQYRDSPALEVLFNRHADVPTCLDCAHDGIQPFECRVMNKHTSGLQTAKDDRQLSHFMFVKLSASKRFWIEKGDDIWICHSCFTDNKRSRCFLCMAWKGGQRGNKRRVESQEGATASKAAKLPSDHEDSVTVRQGQNDIPQDALDDPWQSSVVSTSPAVHEKHWECPECRTQHPTSTTTCHDCDSKPSKKKSEQGEEEDDDDEEKEDHGLPWNCRKCTLENESSMLSCQLCHARRERTNTSTEAAVLR